MGWSRRRAIGFGCNRRTEVMGRLWGGYGVRSAWKAGSLCKGEKAGSDWSHSRKWAISVAFDLARRRDSRAALGLWSRAWTMARVRRAFGLSGIASMAIR